MVAADPEATASDQSLAYLRLHRRAAQKRARLEHALAPPQLNQLKVLEDTYLELSRQYADLARDAVCPQPNTQR